MRKSNSVDEILSSQYEPDQQRARVHSASLHSQLRKHGLASGAPSMKESPHDQHSTTLRGSTSVHHTYNGYRLASPRYQSNIITLPLSLSRNMHGLTGSGCGCSESASTARKLALIESFDAAFASLPPRSVIIPSCSQARCILTIIDSFSLFFPYFLSTPLGSHLATGKLVLPSSNSSVPQMFLL